IFLRHPCGLPQGEDQRRVLVQGRPFFGSSLLGIFVPIPLMTGLGLLSLCAVPHPLPLQRLSNVCQICEAVRCCHLLNRSVLWPLGVDEVQGFLFVAIFIYTFILLDGRLTSRKLVNESAFWGVRPQLWSKINGAPLRAARDARCSFVLIKQLHSGHCFRLVL